MPEKIPLVYLFMFKRLKERSEGKNYIHTYDLLETMSRNLGHLIPKSLRYPIIKEMEHYNLISRVNKFKYALTGGNKDLILVKYITQVI